MVKKKNNCFQVYMALTIGLVLHGSLAAEAFPECSVALPNVLIFCFGGAVTVRVAVPV
jgi:hypothetical protein